MQRFLNSPESRFSQSFWLRWELLKQEMFTFNGLRRWYKSIQSQSQVLGRAGNSRAENGATPSLHFIPVPFSPGGRGRSRLEPSRGVPGALTITDSPFSLFLSLPSTSDPAAAAVEGNLSGKMEFSRHSPPCNISQTFPLSLLAAGADPAGTSPSLEVPGVLLQGQFAPSNPSLAPLPSGPLRPSIHPSIRKFPVCC